MTYELAKELKEAGFPQTPHRFDGSYYWTPNGGELRRKELHSLRDVKVPSLSELIEWCGERFNALENVAGQGWAARGDGNSKYEIGPTPDEAVARLGIALQANTKEK